MTSRRYVEVVATTERAEAEQHMAPDRRLTHEEGLWRVWLPVEQWFGEHRPQRRFP